MAIGAVPLPHEPLNGWGKEGEREGGGVKTQADSRVPIVVALMPLPVFRKGELLEKGDDDAASARVRFGLEPVVGVRLPAEHA